MLKVSIAKQDSILVDSFCETVKKFVEKSFVYTHFGRNVLIKITDVSLVVNEKNKQVGGIINFKRIELNSTNLREISFTEDAKPLCIYYDWLSHNQNNMEEYVREILNLKGAVEISNEIFNNTYNTIQSIFNEIKMSSDSFLCSGGK